MAPVVHLILLIINMELTLNIKQLQLKSEYLHTDPKRTHYHEHSENPLFVSWHDSVTVLYPLCGLPEASLWNPVEPIVSYLCFIIVENL